VPWVATRQTAHPPSDAPRVPRRRHFWDRRQRLTDAGIRPSRGRAGTALDNALAESVIATIKTELSSRRPWPSRFDLELAVAGCVGRQNHGRIPRGLGGRTPAEVDHDYRSTLTTQTTKL